jgi:hypothetical protein
LTPTPSWPSFLEDPLLLLLTLLRDDLDGSYQVYGVLRVPAAPFPRPAVHPWLEEASRELDEPHLLLHAVSGLTLSHLCLEFQIDRFSVDVEIEELATAIRDLLTRCQTVGDRSGIAVASSSISTSTENRSI